MRLWVAPRLHAQAIHPNRPTPSDRRQNSRPTDCAALALAGPTYNFRWMRDVGRCANMPLMTIASDRSPVEPLFAYNGRLWLRVWATTQATALVVACYIMLAAAGGLRPFFASRSAIPIGRSGSAARRLSCDRRSRACMDDATPLVGGRLRPARLGDHRGGGRDQHRVQRAGSRRDPSGVHLPAVLLGDRDPRRRRVGHTVSDRGDRHETRRRPRRSRTLETSWQPASRSAR